MIFGSSLGSAAYGSWTIYGTVGTPDQDAELNDYRPVETRVRFITVKGRDRFFPVTPDELLKVRG